MDWWTWLLLGIGVGWVACSLGVKSELSPEEKFRLMRKWLSERQ